jgi:hypothetical protein
VYNFQARCSAPAARRLPPTARRNHRKTCRTAGSRIRTPDSLPEEARRNPRKTGGPRHFRSRIQNSASVGPAFNLFALQTSQTAEKYQTGLVGINQPYRGASSILGRFTLRNAPATALPPRLFAF